MIIGETLPPTIDDLIGAEHLKSRDEIVVIVGVLVVLPLSLVRNISSLTTSSGVAFISIVVLVLGVLLAGPDEAHTQGLSFDVSKDLTIVNKHMFRGLGVLSFHYVCQHSCLLIFKSLETPSIEDVQDVSRLTFALVLLFSLLIGVGGYVFFGETVSGNILDNFNTHSKWR